MYSEQMGGCSTPFIDMWKRVVAHPLQKYCEYVQKLMNSFT